MLMPTEEELSKLSYELNLAVSEVFWTNKFCFETPKKQNGDGIECVFVI